MSLHKRNSASLKLSVLDIWSDVTDAIELAEAADRFGLHRYWLAEHQPQPNPQMVAALIAGVTERIRVGTAGILLQLQAPVQAAQQFLLMEHVFPGRIDAGFCGGRASGLLQEALLDGRPDRRNEPRFFEERAETFIGLTRGNLPASHPYAALQAWPEASRAPEIWGFGGRSTAELAARSGIAFGYSLFHSHSTDDTASADAYRDLFQANSYQPEPLVAIAVAGVCAETEREAQRLCATHRNEYIVPTVVGSPRQCREQLEAIAERYGTLELAFLDVAPDLPSRVNSYRLLAEAVGLAEPEPAVCDTATYRDFYLACTD